MFRLLAMCLIFLSLNALRSFPVFAQADALPTDAPVYLLQKNRLSQLDVATGSPQRIAEFTPLINAERMGSDRVDRRLWAADIDPMGRYLYQVEAWGRSTNWNILNAPTGAELVRIDLATNEREIVFDRTTVFDFVLSPDGQRMVVFYYVEEYLHSRQNACILELQTLGCEVLDFENVGMAEWLSSKTFLVRSADINPLQVIDAENGESQTLVFPPEWQIYWGTRLPKTHSLLVSGQPYENALQHPIHFLIYDLDSGNVEFLPYTAPNTVEYITVNELQLSPNAGYLLYKGFNTALVNFESGELIEEFTSIYSAGWIDDKTLIVQGSRAEGQLEIMRVNAASGEITTLVSGESASGMLLFP